VGIQELDPVSSKHQYGPSNPHGAKTQDFYNMIIMAKRTSNLIYHIHVIYDTYDTCGYSPTLKKVCSNLQLMSVLKFMKNF
jgi:hypothetical protein